MENSLYFDAALIDDYVVFPTASAVGIFVLKFCWDENWESLPFKINLCMKETNGDIGITRVPRELLRTCVVLENRQLPESVARCQLPVLTTHNGLMIHCGLCSVLRALISELDQEQTHLKLADILGFRGMCLKACAEVSVWTKFCEVQVQDLANRIAKESNRNSGEDNLPFQSAGRKTSVCEELYSDVYNHDLQLRTPHSRSEHMEFDCDALLSNEKLPKDTYIPGLEHLYAEGADFTLTDLILFPCISFILAALESDSRVFQEIPNIISWYNRLKATRRFQSAIFFTKLPVLNIDESVKLKAKKPVSESSREMESKLVKKKVKVNTSDAVPLINKLEGHLGIVIAYLLPECQVLLVENKQESLRRAIGRIKEAHLRNVTLYQSNLDYFTGQFSIGTCLHACGVASDLVLQKCLDFGAAFVVCPCCYGAVQETAFVQYPRSKLYKSLGFSYQEYLVLARAADDQISGKQFMTAVDVDRINEAKECGYDIKLCSLEPLSCSPKNNLLIGIKDAKR